MQPDFIVIGAMKCGTSTLCAYLEDHPDVFMVPRGEPNFFSHDDRFALGTDWYERHFDGHAGERRCGEGSNDYASGQLYPESATRMAAYRPDMKIIYMVRHPLARIASAWVQNRKSRGDQIPPTLDRAVTERAPLYLGQSLYWQNLQRYRAVFPDRQIFVGFMEDLEADPQDLFRRICDFLDIAPTAGVQRPHINPTQGKRIPSPLYTTVNRLPLMKQLKGILPKGLKSMVKDRALSQAITARPEFSPAVAARLRVELADDAASLLHYCGKPPDFWAF